MATVKEINHDSSTTIGDHYGTVTDTDGAITVSAGNALNGSTFGIGCNYAAGVNDVFLSEAYTALTGVDLRHRIRVDVSGVTSTTSGRILTDKVWQGSGDFILEVRVFGGGGGGSISAQAVYSTDSTSGAIGSTVITGEHCLEVRMVKETADGNADGEIEFYVDGVSKGSASDLDNFDLWALGIDDTEIQFWSSDANISGSIKYDEWILNDDSTVALCASGTHIWLSADGAATFTDIGDSAWAANVVGGVVVVPGTAYQTIFAAVGTSLYKTVNGGTAWTLETAVGYEVDFIDLEKDNTTVFLAKRDAAGTNRASLWDSVGASLTHINTGKSTTGGATSGGDVV